MYIYVAHRFEHAVQIRTVSDYQTLYALCCGKCTASRSGQHASSSTAAALGHETLVNDAFGCLRHSNVVHVSCSIADALLWVSAISHTPNPGTPALHAGNPLKTPTNASGARNTEHHDLGVLCFQPAVMFWRCFGHLMPAATTHCLCQCILSVMERPGHQAAACELYIPYWRLQLLLSPCGGCD